jgi:dienelactone hydrolase
MSVTKGGVLGAAVILLGSGDAPARGPVVFDTTAARRGELSAASVPTASPYDDTGAEQISFLSTEWQPDGSARSIRISGYLARPARPGRKPAVIIAHGLGAQADLRTAADVARNLDVVALAISGPGLGASQGTAVTFDDPRRLFSTVPDVRGSWLYAYAFSVQRAITYLQSRSDVDGKVVITGTSLGGIVSYIVNAVDDRVGGILVTNAAGRLAHATAHGSWLAKLIAGAGGLKPTDPGPSKFLGAFDPLAYPNQHGAVYLLAGTQDEFFPLDEVVATFRALRAPAKTLALIADYDHQWFFATGCTAACMPGGPRLPAADCPATCPQECPPPARWPYCGPQGGYNRQSDAMGRWNGLLRALVAQAVKPPRPYGPPPAAPVVERRADRTLVRVSIPNPKAVRLAVSDNGGVTYGNFLLELKNGAYVFRAVSPRSIVFAEVEADDGTVATSVPELPRGFRPFIRPFAPVPGQGTK